jgi:hypothetical protein
MGYFPNGTAGSDFEQRFCSHCINMPDSDSAGCPVWAAHLFFGYEECNGTGNGNAKRILDMLIERGDSNAEQRCVMFVDKRSTPLRTQADIQEAERISKARPKLVGRPKEAT